MGLTRRIERASQPQLHASWLTMALAAFGPFFVIVLVAFAIPNGECSRKGANEAWAIASLRTIHVAEERFHELGHRYGTLDELGAARLVDNVLGHGEKRGYRFEARPATDTPATGWFATATPSIRGETGDRFFAINEGGVIFYSTEYVPVVERDATIPDDLARAGR